MRAPALKYAANRSVGVLALLSCAVGLISGCGPRSPYADALNVAIDPSEQALIGPGPVASCTDHTQYYDAKLASTGGTYVAMTYSVSGPAIVFNTFTLTWKSTDTLYVQEIRAQISAPALSSSPIVVQFTPQEIEALLATDGGVINPPVTQGGSGTPPATTTIVSSAASPRTSTAGTVFASCGLAVGGLALNKNAVNSQFIAQVTIDVIGTAVDSSGNERFVSYRILATAHYYGS